MYANKCTLCIESANIFLYPYHDFVDMLHCIEYHINILHGYTIKYLEYCSNSMHIII